MRRGLVVAFAIAATLLAVTSMPVAAQNASAVASEHTTFGTGSAGEPSPTTLQNMSVEGSGESASVSLGSTATASMPAEETTKVDPGRYGLKLEIDKATDELSGTLYSSTDATTAYVTQTDGTVIAQASISNNEVTFTGLGLSAGQSVYLVADRGGSSTKFGRAEDLASTYPVTTDKFNVTAGVFDGAGENTFYGYTWASISAPTGTVSGEYVGGAHSAEDIQTGRTNLSLTNASATVTWQEDADGDGTFTNVTATTYTSSGNKTADLSTTTSDRWRVRVDVDTTGPDPVAEINDEGVLFASANSTPALSDPEPPDQAKIENAVGNVSINVSDSGFGLAQGDTVTVSATADDGTSLGSTTVTGNGTASLSYTSENGQNVIDWTATDEYGNTDTFRQTFATPSTLIIRNESAPPQVVNTSSNVTVTFFDRSGQNIIKRSSSNGRIDLSGIPTDTEYVIQVDAAGFRSRQVIITSLFDQQNVYLLPTSRAAATVEFTLNDQTSRFPSDETTLFIQKPITRNNSTEFRTVFADQFGATDSLRVDLRDQERYRIQVRNDQGETRVLESFTASGDAVAPLTIGSVEVSGSVDERGVAFASDVIERDGARLLRITYQDPAQQTAEITVQVRQNGSQVVPNITGTAGYGRFVTTVNITGRSTAEDYNVTFEAVRNGETVSGGDVGGGVGELSFGLDPFLRQLIGWGAILALTGLVVIRSPRLAPATGTLTGTMLTIIGVLTIPAPALGIAGAISVLSVYSRGGGA